MTIPGTVTVTGPIAPTNLGDSYPTHFSIYGKGGHAEVATLVLRDAIPTGRRMEGMLRYVVEDQKTYQLVGGITNANWEEFSGGGAGGLLRFADVTTAEAQNDTNLIYIDSVDSLYRYVADGSAYPVDHIYSLDTSDGGTSRYLAVAGQYAIHELCKKVETVLLAEAQEHLQLLYVTETDSWYRYEAAGAGYVRDGLSVLNTSNGGNTRYLAVTGRYSLSNAIMRFATVAEAEAQTFNGLVYIVETETMYDYVASAGSYTRNGVSVLSTSSAGDTRYLAYAGKYFSNAVAILRSQTTPSAVADHVQYFVQNTGGNDSYTKLLLHCNNGAGSMVFTDSSENARAVTSHNSAAQSITRIKFGTSAGVFDGVNQYLSTADSVDFTLGSNSFCIESYVNLTELGRVHVLYSQGTDGNNFICMRITAANIVEFLFKENSVRRVALSGGSLTTNSWYHVAVVRNGATWELYVNMTRVATGTYAGAIPDYAAVVEIGSNSSVVDGNSTTLLTSLYAEWRLNESSGTISYDSTVNARNATLTGSVNWTTGKINNGFLFDGASYFGAGDIAGWDRTQAFSISLWFKNTATGLKAFVSRYNAAGVGWLLEQNSSEYIWFGLYGSSQVIRFTLTTRYNDGNWHHLVATYDGSSAVAGISVYVDNALAAGTTTGTTLTQTIVNTVACTIGARSNGSNQFNGTLDDVAIWTKVLSVSEISELYNAGSGIEVPDNIKYYMKGYFDEYRVSNGAYRFDINSVLSSFAYDTPAPFWRLPDGSAVSLGAVTYSSQVNPVATRRTIIDITQTLPSGTVFSVIGSGTGYTKSRDNGFLGNNISEFEETKYLRIELNGVNCVKSRSAEWVTATTFRLNGIVDNGDTIEIYS